MKIKNFIKTGLKALSIVGCQSADSQSNKLFIPKTKKTEVNSIRKKNQYIKRRNYN